MNQVQGPTFFPRFVNFSAREVLLLAALMMPIAFALIDSGMLAVALPVIQDDFGVSVDLLSWVVAASVFSRVTLMAIYGQLGDRLGKKRLYLFGILIFAVGATVGIVAPTFSWLVFGRLLQGVGGASFPLAMALIVDAFPSERQGRALGIWNTAAPGGIILGPVIGGVIVEAFGWHAIFFIVALGALTALLFIMRLVPNPRQVPTDKALDWFGALSLTVTVAALLLATTTSSAIPFWSPLNLVFWGVACLGILSLIWNALKRSNPFVGFDILRNRRFITPAVAVNLRMFAHDGGRFLMVLYLANVFGQSPKLVGLLMLFYGLPLLLGVAFGGVLADRWAVRTAGALGMLGLAAGMLWMGLVRPSGNVLALAPGMVVAGFLGGTCLVPFSKKALSSLGEERVGLAAGLYNTLRFAGSAAATPLLGLLLAQGFARQGGLETVGEPYQLGFMIIAGTAGLGISVATLIPRGKTA